MSSENTHPFIDRVRATIDEFDLLSPGERVLVALSGGADSMALLHALRALGYSVEAAHLNHQLRGDDSDADQCFVVEHCAKLGVACHCAADDVAAHAAATGVSLEAAARERRYEFLSHVAAMNGIEIVATAHHADDQAETVLMRVLRGASTSGLGGIPPFRQEDDVCIVRPLLRCTRSEIMAWLEAQDLPWCEDASNADTDFLRNRVRHELLPQLQRDYNPQLAAALCRMADNLREDAALLDAISDDAAENVIDEKGRINPTILADYPEVIQRRVIQQWLWYVGVDLDSDRLRAAAAFATHSETGKYFDAGGAVQLYRGKELVEIVDQDASIVAPRPLTLSGETEALGYRFTVTRRPRGNHENAAFLRTYCTPARQLCDADVVGTSVFVRTRRDGDRITPLGMEGSRKLQDYFVDKGVPAPQRDRIPLIATETDIVWIVGHAVDGRFAVGERTRRVLEIEVRNAAE